MPKRSSAARHNQPPWMQGAYAAPMGMQADYAAHTGVPLAKPHHGAYMVPQVFQPFMYNMPGRQQQAVPQYVTVPVNALHMNGHSHGHKSKKQRAAERLNAAHKLVKGNGIQDFSNREEQMAALNRLADQNQIQVHGVDELKVILARYISKKQWLEQSVDTIVTAMTNAAAGDFTGDWTPAKLATKHPKQFRGLVEKALKGAKKYVKRQAERAHPSALAPPAAEKADARFTSMRF
jgi:hypothetical protein